MRSIKPKSVATSKQVVASGKKLLAVRDHLRSRLLGKNSEIEALMLCLLSRQHLMLEGLHGIAKSLLVTKFLDYVTNDVVPFNILMTKDTSVEQLFGLPNIEKFKSAHPVWEYNTDRMLPEAHVAYIDEVYRGSGYVLPAIMRILNERRFTNAGKEVSCPLMTAIGTTNFITDDPELEAFHDRWLVKIKCKPLDSVQARVEAVKAVFADEEEDPDIQPVTLSDLKILQEAEACVEIPETHIVALFDAAHLTASKIKNRYISDRRYIHTVQFLRSAKVFRLLQAAIKNGDDVIDTESTDSSYLFDASYALGAIGDTEFQAEFTNNLAKTVKEIASYDKEQTNTEVLEGALRKAKRRLEELLEAPEEFSIKELEDFEKKCNKYVAAIDKADATTMPTSQSLLQRWTRARNEMEEIRLSVIAALEAKTKS